MPPKIDDASKGHSRDSSTGSIRHAHVPATPSQLRQAHAPSDRSSSPEEAMHRPRRKSYYADDVDVAAEAGSAQTDFAPAPPHDGIVEVDISEPNARSRLLDAALRDDWARPGVARNYGSFAGSVHSDSSFGGAFPGITRTAAGEEDPSDPTRALLGDAFADGVVNSGDRKNMSTTRWLAERHGIKSQRWMYLQYYIPVLSWTRQYKWRYLKGDLIAAITMASFYIPMALSYASNLAHLPPVHGLYSFAINPLIYGILGTCPQMIVGPEAPGSLLVGEIVRENISKGASGEGDGRLNAEIAGIVTCMAGGFIFVAGIFRLGFLDNVLSRPFLRGFISAIGVVIFIDQLIPETGLARLAAKHVAHGSSLDKLVFLVKNIHRAHKLTCAMSFAAFFIIMFFREFKKRLQPRYPSVAYIPDRFLVVVFSAILTWHYRLDQHGLAVLGDVNSSGALFSVHFPFDTSHLKYAGDAVNTGLIIALLGFFESSVAAKSLGAGDTQKDGVQLPLSANRELIALGTANMTGGLFMALPAFGGYGRSKVNASTGGLTPMSNIFLSIITILSTLFLLPYFYFLPKGVLCAMVSVVAYSLVEEAPHDIKFFLRIRGWSELALMGLIFGITIVWDLKRGIGVGIGLSILRLIKHSVRPRIQILGRVPGTTSHFANAELAPDALEFVAGCLIVKIPEPLTFANTGNLRSRLSRLEDHGTAAAHPALPRIRRREHNQNVIFDVHGVTSLDGAGAQVLSEIVAGYRARGVRVFFCRVPPRGSQVWRLLEASGVVEMCGGEGHFVGGVEEALRRVDLERLTEEEGSEGVGSAGTSARASAVGGR
ncbi:sulfate transporter family-domain-containing protein [Boeremia exigua]|uniref:sulfate transporter family-domain-containing protein n=1 Tax=Boeremia exigua TaxID=749465 RepID=UPI001E8E437D|nr:sulfate transporter family-domain-containing protein [Boeremia exigua]KAH6629678.1 sulfate transporter family-domain-containing protein [Boeremia exigua]